ncbi:MAG: hypothetical protein KAJ75_09695, partial [Alphaproteobacteria bacterium]|nr:hypothetical protein [Alphaproteobacteria bacterium]
MIFAEKKRGLDESFPDQLTLKRNWILHFDGSGYTVQDEISGTINKSWRMEVKAGNELGRVSIDGNDQLITRGESGLEGVEVRPGYLRLNADSRVMGDITKLDAVGWNHDFEKVSGKLRLPPGWTMFMASGVDKASPTWIRQWSLLDVFIVLITSVAMFKLLGGAYGVVSLATLVLTHTEFGALAYMALIILGANALIKVLPEGWFLKLTTFIKRATIAILIITVFQFTVPHIRKAMYPQLGDFSYSESGYGYGRGRHVDSIASGVIEKSVLYEAEQTMADEKWEGKRMKMRSIAPSLSYQSARKNKYLLQNLMPNANVQTGYGITKWSGRSIYLNWSGQVDSSQKLSLVLISARTNLFLAFIRIAMIALFLGCLLIEPDKIRTIKSKLGIRAPKTGKTVVLALLASLLCSTAAFASEKNDFPPQYVLDDLKAKLVAKPDNPPKCMPECATVAKASLVVKGERLTIRQRIHIQ